LGEWLRSARRQRGLTQVMLAQHSGVSQNYISALETGRASNPSRPIASRLAQALAVPVSDLLLALAGESSSDTPVESQRDSEVDTQWRELANLWAMATPPQRDALLAVARVFSNHQVSS
jgi:transcriptional regulator with XRE-family HTH domain